MNKEFDGLIKSMNSIADQFDEIAEWTGKSPEQEWLKSVRDGPAPLQPYAVPPYVYVKMGLGIDNKQFAREVNILYRRRTKAPEFAKYLLRPFPPGLTVADITFVGPDSSMSLNSLVHRAVDVRIAVEEAVDYPNNLTSEQRASLVDDPADARTGPASKVGLKERIAEAISKRQKAEEEENAVRQMLALSPDKNKLPSCFEIEELRRQARDYFERAIEDPLDRDQDLLALAEALEKCAVELEKLNPYCQGFWVTLPSQPEKMVLFNPADGSTFRVGEKSPGRNLKSGDMIVLDPGDFIPDYSALPQPKETTETRHISLYVKWSFYYVHDWDKRSQSTLHTPMTLSITLEEAMELELLDRAEWEYFAFTYPDIVKDIHVRRIARSYTRRNYRLLWRPSYANRIAFCRFLSPVLIERNMYSPFAFAPRCYLRRHLEFFLFV